MQLPRLTPSCGLFMILQVGLTGRPGDARPPGPGSVVRVTASPLTHAAQRPLGRIPVLNVAPDIDGGAFPAESVVQEEFDVTATVFREGHDAVNATVVLTDPAGAESLVPMTLLSAGLDHWSAT